MATTSSLPLQARRRVTVIAILIATALTILGAYVLTTVAASTPTATSVVGSEDAAGATIDDVSRDAAPSNGTCTHRVVGGGGHLEGLDRAHTCGAPGGAPAVGGVLP